MIDREKVERLIAALEQHGRRWKVGDDASEKRSADCTNASDTLRALSARVAELEAENARLRGALDKMFDAAQQVHRDGGRELARLVTEHYDG